MMGYGFGGFGWGGMIIGLILAVVFIVGLVFLILWAVRRAGGNVQPGTHLPVGQPAIEIVKARYAKGEITREEYQAYLSDLER